MKKKKILITGVSGYIGSCLNVFFRKKFTIYSLDKKKPQKWIKINKKNFFHCDLLNKKKLGKIFKKIKPDLIIHLAAKSTVNEKINKENYKFNNINATKNLLEVMRENCIDKIIFSSTAAVYDKSENKIEENYRLNPISTYGKTKLAAERIIYKKKDLNFVILRFFNVSGSIKNPTIGEFHNPETHLIPTVVYKSLKNKKINIFGNNYNTIDGTCVRDYVHIKDICRAILLSANYLFKKINRKIFLNIGNGYGISNLQVVNKLNNYLKINTKINYTNRRKGDHSFLVCDIKKAKKTINWSPIYSSISNIMKDELKWSKKLIKLKIKRFFYNDK